jgi:hypothetical protein
MGFRGIRVAPKIREISCRSTDPLLSNRNAERGSPKHVPAANYQSGKYGGFDATLCRSEYHRFKLMGVPLSLEGNPRASTSDAKKANLDGSVSAQAATAPLIAPSSVPGQATTQKVTDTPPSTAATQKDRAQTEGAPCDRPSPNSTTFEIDDAPSIQHSRRTLIQDGGHTLFYFSLRSRRLVRL